MDSVDGIAKRLDRAMQTGVTIAPLSESDGITDLNIAYTIQKAWTNLRTARGERVVGRKIGLTSEAIQKQLGVDQPARGNLWNTTYYQAHEGRVELATDKFSQPRIEGEVAFLIGKPLRGSADQPITAKQVLEATDACALGIEIAASRITDWKIKLTDMVSDNAAYGGFITGPWDKQLVARDLAGLTMSITQNGTIAAEGIGAAVLGHPANAVAWLANKLALVDEGLEPGDMVISGALAKMLPVKAGDEFVFNLSTQPPLVVKFT